MSEYYLTPPRTQTFYKMILYNLSVLYGLSDDKWWGIKLNPLYTKLAKTHGNLIKIVCPITIILLISAFVDYKILDFSTTGIMFSILPVGMIVFVKLMTARFESYATLMKNFLDKIHLHSYYMQEKDNFVKMVLLEVERYTRITFYFIGGFLSIDWLSWVVIPVINNIQNREAILNKTFKLRTCLYVWMPFDYYYDFRNWLPIHCFSTYIVFGGCLIVAIFDTINFAFVFHLIGHIKILKHSIEVRFDEKDMSDDEHKKGLIEIFNKHCFIVNTFDEMQSAFGINVAGNYMQNLLGDSLLLYEMMYAETGDKIPFGIMLIVYAGELIIMSFILEEVRRQSEDLPEVLYCIPWENMSVSNQKIFKLVLLKVQPMLCFKAAGGMMAGVKPMMSILKSTFSYYVMLKSSIKS